MPSLPPAPGRGGSRPDDMLKVPIIVNGLWSQPKRSDESDSRITAVRRKSDSAGADKLLLFGEELKAKEKCIEVLSSKLSRATTALDTSNRSRKVLEQRIDAMAQEVARAAESSQELEQQLRACEDRIAQLQNHCSSQQVDLQSLMADLERSKQEPPALIARLEEETHRREAVERMLGAERAVVRQWLQRSGRGAEDVGEPAAALLAAHIELLETSLLDKEKAELAALERAQDLEEWLEAEREWRTQAQAAAAAAEDAGGAARARARGLALQLERARAEAHATAARLRELQAAAEARDAEACARREALKHRKHRIVTDKLAVSKALDDRVESLEKQLAQAREQAQADVAAARAEGNARAHKLKQRAVALAKRCVELEQAGGGDAGGDPLSAAALCGASATGAKALAADGDPALNNKGAPAWMNFNFEVK
ncbi:hypothetical protein JKP88DRAFT_253484 [Tribonema minus]|uniref:Uncharacterized protein n=1 Tax=Tribonema minus TaxID=303371 RepID=A0A835Z802_9STRA|nr:hypothetical protein JKP88DRAFT_253484 [Tribonema minus]